MERGKLIVVSAPSGCGKGTILGEVLKDPKFYFSVSCTTRQPREGEVDGVNYNFITRERFEELIAENAFLEYATYVDNYYGSLLGPIEENLAKGKDVLLEIEVKGAEQIRALRPDASLIFIVPPSLDVLRERLIKRGTEPMDVIEKRVAKAKEELTYRDRYDYCLVNDKLEDAVADFLAIVRAIELKVEK
ncbi:MAG: guanylate kinase [Oscillospiraceae bacterium]|nr:guanylate kinase [Oscillospiraceae bacterium]